MGSHGWGARKKHKKSGHRGGKGMSGSGKRADHKKTLVTKLFGNTYFGKQGVTSRKTQRDTRQRINLGQIQLNLATYLKKAIARKVGTGYEVSLPNYKILGNGEIKDKMIIFAKEASKSALEKIKKVGGEIRFDGKIDKAKKSNKKKE